MSKKIEMGKREERLFNKLRLDVKRANQRLVRLERNFGKDTWAAKRIKEKLDNDVIIAWSETGRVKLNKKMSYTQLKAVEKATKAFLNSKTSTKKGIKETIKNVKQGFKEALGDENAEISDEGAETMYDFMSNESFRSLADKVGASTAMVIVEDARSANDSELDFLTRVKSYIERGFDADFKDKLRKLYKESIYPYISHDDKVDEVYRLGG